VKKLSYILLFLLFVSSCGQGGHASPEAATKYFLQELGDAEFENAASSATPTMAKQVRLLHTEWKMSNESERKVMQQSLKTDFKALICNEVDGIMICSVCCNAEGDTARLELQQHDGSWFVHQ
jgi:hypothetical protein